VSVTPEPMILAFDGGSTKTDALLVSGDGSVLGRARVGPSNHQLVGIDGVLAALGEAVELVAAQTGLGQRTSPLCEVGVYCLAGLDLAIDDERLAPAIASRHWTSTDLLHNDTLAVSRAGSESAWGIGVVCGTGMNCAGVGPDGSTIRFPALAELSGDFAPGGSWLGMRALGLALRANDGRGAPTVLTERVAAHFDLPDPETVLAGVYTGTIPYGRIFELARVLLDAAADGDQQSRLAANVLADEVVAFAGAAITRLDLTAQEVDVVMGGGIFQTDDAGFHARVADGIHAVAPLARLKILDAPPVLGAALLGLDAIGADDAAKEKVRTALLAL
jgi:N-acetylglucosamine kinase-like BadF-type ATPase